MNDSTLSLQEKTAWASLITTLVVFVPYFLYVFSWLPGRNVPPGTVFSLLAGAVIIHVVLITVTMIVVAVSSRKEPTDERDALISAKALRNGYSVLSVALTITACSLLIMATDAGDRDRAWLFAPAFVSHVFLAVFVAGEVTRFATQVVCYRRGS